MENIGKFLKHASQQYNKSLPHDAHCRTLVMAAHNKLSNETKYIPYGAYAGKPPVPYNVFSLGNDVSRPVRPDLYISDPQTFPSCYDELINSLRVGPAGWSDADISRANQVVYTAVMSIACCYDIWKRSSRKTPGTFFEILMASLLQQMLPGAEFSKHIPLATLLHDPDVEERATDDTPVEQETVEAEKESSVSTDLVISLPLHAGGIVVPLKITTRERIVQPFAHQRILDSAFGAETYQSLLVCISETQLDDKTRSVKQVCVPGTVKLFQKYLAPMKGLYYCDLPQRYVAADMQRVIPVRSVGHFFLDLNTLLNAHSASAS